MKRLPRANNAIVLRTDFSDDAAWEAVCALLMQPSAEGFRAHVEFINDRDFEGVTPQSVLQLLPEGANREFMCTFIFLVDGVAVSTPEHPVLVVNLYDEPGRSFRAVPSGASSIENNLSIANMDFDDFADAVDRDGIFRGFRES
jgi:hypothetical protein